MKLIIDALIGGVFAPALFAAAVLLRLWRFRRDSQPIGHWAGAVAVGGGFFVGYAALRIAPLWPVESWHWLPYAALLVCVLDTFGSIFLRRGELVWVVRIVAAALAAWLLVPKREEIADEQVLWIIGLAVAALALWTVLGRVSISQVLRHTLLTALAFLAATIISERSGSAKLAQLAAIEIPILCTLGLLEFLRCRRASGSSPDTANAFAAWAARGAVPALSALLPGLLLNRYLDSFSDVPAASYLLVSLAPVALGVGYMPQVRRLSGGTVLAIQSGLVVSILVVAIGLAFWGEPITASDW